MCLAVPREASRGGGTGNQRGNTALGHGPTIRPIERRRTICRASVQGPKQIRVNRQRQDGTGLFLPDPYGAAKDVGAPHGGYVADSLAREQQEIES